MNVPSWSCLFLPVYKKDLFSYILRRNTGTVPFWTIRKIHTDIQSKGWRIHNNRQENDLQAMTEPHYHQSIVKWTNKQEVSMDSV